MSKHNFDPAVRPASQIRRNKLKRARGDEWIEDFLTHAHTATISTSWDDMPFNNVTLFWYDAPNERIIFHANIMGRVRANIEKNPKVCLSCYEMGRLLPSNAALEFSVQYRSVVVFGEAHLIPDPDEASAALVNLISKYFPNMESGKEYRPITELELRLTSVFAIEITEWSGKENWKERTSQIDDLWPPLPAAILNGDVG